MSLMKIGSLALDNNLLLAPMAGITDTCFRRIARRLGAGLVWTEMISATGLARRAPGVLEALELSPDEGMVAVQLVGSDPRDIAEAARIARSAGAAIVDLNAGCPVKKVCATGAGASLLRDPPRLAKILGAMRAAVSCPVTVKIRSGWESHKITASEIARVAEESGADAVILHPRTASQGFRGRADWDLVLALKQERAIPIVGNGDICSPEAARDALSRTGCDAIMIGRAARGDPWIFGRTRAYLEAHSPPSPPSLSERKEIMLVHLESALSRYGALAGTKRMRPQLAWYVKGLPMARWFRTEIQKLSDPRSLRDAIVRYFARLEASCLSSSWEEGCPET